MRKLRHREPQSLATIIQLESYKAGTQPRSLTPHSCPLHALLPGLPWVALPRA